MAAGGRARADGLAALWRPTSFHRIASLSLPFRLARERNGRGRKRGRKRERERERKNEGSDLREKLMFSLESRLSVG